jgi:arylsulfatase
MTLRRGLAAVLVCLAAPPAARATTTDLLEALRADESASAKPVRINLVTAHGKARTAVMSAIPNRIDLPVRIPAHGRLRVGFTLQDQFLGGQMIERTRPTRFTATLALPDGRAEVLFERILDPRGRAADRRWVDRTLDLSRFAGREATLRLTHALADDPEAAGLTFALWSRPVLYDAAEQRERPNLLFITIDALRASHLGSAGYARPTSPNLDRLAREGIRFAAAFTNAPMTVPSLPQILSSAVFPTGDSPNLLSSLAAGGIRRTAAFIHNPFLGHWLTIRARDGFDVVHDTAWRADRLSRAAIKWLDAFGGERFALYLHFLDTHTPYQVPEPWATTFADPAYRGPIGARFGDVDGAQAGRYGPEDRRHVIALYDGAIRFVDAEVGRVLDHLAARNLLDSTLVVVSADHGEELWDRGGFFHGQSLHDELLHVPLLVRLPGGAHAGRVVTAQVPTLDIVPTIADVLALPSFPEFEGESLLPLVAGDTPGPPRLVFARAANPRFPYRFAVRTPSHKLIQTVDPWGEELYDLGADPGERRNLIDDPGARDVLARLRAEMNVLRRPLAHTGYQVRAIAPPGTSDAIEVTLTGPDGPPLQNPDRIGLGPADRLSFDREGHTLTWHGTVPTVPAGLRFDRGLFRDPDPGLEIRVRVGGRDLPPSAIRLGAAGEHPPTSPFTYKRVVPALFAPTEETPPLLAATPPVVTANGDGVTVFIWRSSDAAPATVAPAPDDEATRQRLRALGYAE